MLLTMSVEFLANVVAGVVSGLVVLIGQHLSRKALLRQRFHTLAGKYQIWKLAEDGKTYELQADRFVRITYLGENLLRTEGINAADRVEWTGTIAMREALPRYGEGVYSYHVERSCGTHTVQVESNGEFLVYGLNTSFIFVGGSQNFYRLWKPITLKKVIMHLTNGTVLGSAKSVWLVYVKIHLE